MLRLNVTMQAAIVRELDELVAVGASGSRSATLAGLVRASWRATFPELAAEQAVMQSPGPVVEPEGAAPSSKAVSVVEPARAFSREDQARGRAG